MWYKQKTYINPEEIEGLEEQLVKLNRTTKVVKGGRRFRFSALMVVGNKQGVVGMGYGKANEIPEAIRKGVEKAKKTLVKVNLQKSTIPHEVTQKYCASKVWMKPAAEGTGIIAGRNIRAVLEYAGVRNILTKTYGSRNIINASKAAFKCLKVLANAKEMSEMRSLEDIKMLFN